jgi:hypothetical protein
MRLLAAHIIFTAYGFWLPNDPRGSWSEWVAAWELFRFGKVLNAIGYVEKNPVREGKRRQSWSFITRFPG